MGLKGRTTSVEPRKSRIPVILDTDIGGDIDDTWALVMMLKSAELDVKLVVSDTGDTNYRTKIIAKMLEIAGRTDIPVGVGIPFKMQKNQYSQAAWVDEYLLSKYKGKVYDDGIDAIIQTIMTSPEPVTLICIGPVPNIAEALRREPRIVENARFVGMHGSVRFGYGGSPQISNEYNVRADVAACRAAFNSPWEVMITPVDTCGLVVLKGTKYALVRDCPDPLIQALIENYRIWAKLVKWTEADAETQSSTLFDTVAVYLAFAEDLLNIEKLGIRVTDDGYTVIDENAKHIHVATEWKNLDAFENLLVHRITGRTNLA